MDQNQHNKFCYMGAMIFVSLNIGVVMIVMEFVQKGKMDWSSPTVQIKLWGWAVQFLIVLIVVAITMYRAKKKKQQTPPAQLYPWQRRPNLSDDDHSDDVRLGITPSPGAERINAEEQGIAAEVQEASQPAWRKFLDRYNTPREDTNQLITESSYEATNSDATSQNDRKIGSQEVV